MAKLAPMEPVEPKFGIADLSEEDVRVIRSALLLYQEVGISQSNLIRQVFPGRVSMYMGQRAASLYRDLNN